MAVTVITGGAGHLGRAIGERCLSDGDAVYLVDRNPEVRDIASDMGAQGVVADVCDESQLDVLGALADVDRLVCAVGSWPRIPWNELTSGDWQESISVNLTSAYQSVKVMTKALKNASGSIVFVGSAIAFKGHAEMTHYAAAKAGLHGLAKSLCLAMGPDGVRVNVVAPGLIETPDAEETWDLEDRKAFWAQRALRKPLTMENVVDAVCFLSGAQAGAITGQVLVVDGGLVLH
jgi:3-oxoacyl-[acyl-carrier protein] reductase